MDKKTLIESALFLETIQPNQEAFAMSLSLEQLKNYLIMQGTPLPKVEVHQTIFFKAAE